MAKDHLTMRVAPETLRGIEREANRTGRPLTTLAGDLLEEGLAMRLYPGIAYREGAAGRRPALIGHRIDVHQVVETVREEGGGLERAASYFRVPVGLVRSAMEYYADHKDAVDQWIAREREYASDAEERWRRGRDPEPR
ncbi:MAG: hypothetical protein JOZ75_00140 [Candidatus Dormibacteraeota bacterium]|nr:hypothetical protein [Candidatus Dormibacteraeota bacterium]